MKTHPYLRAYMAGIAIPTMFLLVVMTGFTLLRYVYNFPVPIERVIVFPMAVLPNLWGVWNMAHLALRSRGRKIPLGLYGAILPFVLAPLAYLTATSVHFAIPAVVLEAFPYGFPVAIILYYLVWKHIVGFFNEELGIA